MLMSALSDYYIHYNYQNYLDNNEGWELSQYAGHLHAAQQAAIEDFNKAFKQLWNTTLTTLKPYTTNFNAIREKLIDDDLTNDSWVTQVAEQMVERIPAVASSSILYQDNPDSQELLNRAQALLSEQKNRMNKIRQFLQNSSNMVNLSIAEQYEPGTVTYLLDNIPNDQILWSNFNRFASQLKKVDQYLENTQDLNIPTLVGKISRFLGMAIGNISEDVYVNLAPNIIQNTFKDLLPDVEIKIVNTGQQRSQKASGAMTMKTTDIALEFYQKQGDNRGQLIVQLPYISLKRSGNSSRPNPTIQIKSTDLQNFFALVGQGKINTEGAKGFIAAFATAGLKLNNQAKVMNQLDDSATVIPLAANAPGLADMYNWVHTVMLPTALAGTLNRDDLVSLFIVNQQVFSVLDIINLDNIWEYVTSTLPSAQESVVKYHQQRWKTSVPKEQKGLARSQKVLQRIKTTKFKMSLLKTFMNKLKS